MNIKKFLSFEKMVTPLIIKVIFWIGIVTSILGGIIIFFGSIINGFTEGGFGSIIIGLLVGVIGGALYTIINIFIARLFSELLILAFSIHENLIEIKDLLKNRP